MGIYDPLLFWISSLFLIFPDPSDLSSDNDNDLDNHSDNDDIILSPDIYRSIG
jgi:hypothetical protein